MDNKQRGTMNLSIKNIRIKNNYNQADFAKLLGVKQRTYASWERKENKLPIEIAFKIADLLEVSLDEIYGHEVQYANLDFVTDSTLRMLLTNYNKLNSTGQRQLLTISRSLIYNPEYIK